MFVTSLVTMRFKWKVQFGSSQFDSLHLKKLECKMLMGEKGFVFSFLVVPTAFQNPHLYTC